MPKILITGNGFDLNLGLPTHYHDFIKILNHLQESSSNDFNSIYELTSNYKVLLDNFESFSLELEKIELLKLKLKSSLWYKFFKDEFRIETWIDFENKIEYVLKTLFESIDKIKKEVFLRGSLNKNSTLDYSSKLLNGKIDIIEVLNTFQIVKHIQSRERIIVNKNYLLQKHNVFTGVDTDKIASSLHEELNKFKIIFSDFFDVFVFPFYNTFKNNIDNNIYDLIDFNFTFNYTQTFDTIYKSNITRFIHGRISSDKVNMVLGINNISNGKSYEKHIIPFTKGFQKIYNNTDYKFTKELLSRRDENYVFFFFGHSLDKSDSEYINEVFDFVDTLKPKIKIKKIVIVYRNDQSRFRMLQNLFEIRGYENIQKFSKREMLKFIKINSTELKEELEEDITLSPYAVTGIF